ncbi:hypothetical protein B9Z55_000890 [Caenorhabditis nigoni]|uniref:Uncharacterized protein n=1 Tax=Caenorhabditis nigoni TaxID=1611254 RepID=A0A2G5VVP0_9PELO|nr:hypothetical protein B9Z55_000890 [Caenorhabditis nigoni]
MKISFLVAIVYCLHVVFCVPTSSITKANSSGEINLLKKLLEQRNVSVKNQKQPATTDPSSALASALETMIKQSTSAQNDATNLRNEKANLTQEISSLKKDLEQCRQCSGSLEELKKNVEEVLKWIGTLKSATVAKQSGSGYALANPPHDQYLLPDGNKQIVIELVEDGNGAHGAYVQRP